MAAILDVHRGRLGAILNRDHLRTIPSNLGFNWPSGFRRYDLKHFPIGFCVENMSVDGCPPVGKLGHWTQF